MPKRGSFVHEFNQDNFAAALSHGLVSKDAVKNDPHADYLFGYLKSTDLAAKTIVEEPKYVDGDYLEDYATYYAKCFQDYGRFCKRVHFFGRKITQAMLEKMLRGDASRRSLERFQDAYLGFVVVRPLPDAIIGRTQLKTYAPANGRRHFKATVDYQVHLFGLPLKVNSLAFQEQDSTVAACATVALWSCFHKTSRLFGTEAPRPARITADATMSTYDRRPIPSTGLYLHQICSAIKHNGLDPEVFGDNALRVSPLVSLIYGYLEMGLPILLGVNVKGMGHAIAVTGYSVQNSAVHKSEVTPPQGFPSPPRLKGLRIDEFYVHDDQNGPFARLRVVPPHAGSNITTFLGSWPSHPRGLIFTPLSVVVPVYPKIRLSYLDALTWVARISALAEPAAQSVGAADFEWDVFLATTNAYKSALREDGSLDPGRKSYLLSRSQARFFWRCILRDGAHKAMVEILIDATGFNKSFPVDTVNFYRDDFAVQFSHLTAQNTGSPGLPTELRVLIAEEFADRFGPAAKAKHKP